MAHGSRRRSDIVSATAPQPVQVWVKTSPRRWWQRLLAVLLVGAGLAGGGLLLALSFRWGFLLMLEPESLPPELKSWLHPETPVPTTTLADIDHRLGEQGQTLGEAISLTAADGGTRLLVPALNPATGEITALMLLQRSSLPPSADGAERLRLLSHLPLQPWNRDRLLTPLADAVSLAPPPLVPTRLIRLFHPALPADVAWFTLEGQWPTPGLTLRYGQIFYADLAQGNLHPLAEWSSPANRLPQWVDWEGDDQPDLVIDEGLGLEVALRGFRAIPDQAGTTQLVEVGWGQVPLHAGAKALDYHRALRLARSGLWREARDQMATLKATLAESWNPNAEAQLRTIARHADLSQQQADRDWSLPTQHILALLIDSRWEEALDRLEASPALLDALLRRLEVDRGPLWNRVVATISLPDPDPAVFVWGGLVLKAQQNDQAAEDWLARHPVPALTRQRLMAVLTPPVDKALVAETVAATTETGATAAIPPISTTAAIAPLTGLMGMAQPTETPNLSRWYTPNDLATNYSGTWYTVTVQALHDGQQWRSRRRDDLPAADLWAAVTQNQRSLTLLHWVSPVEALTVTLTLRGLAMADGQLTLLATGPRLESEGAGLPLLAFSPESLVWLDKTQPQALGLPTPLANTLLPQGSRVSTTLATALATVPQYRLDLTGNGQPEQIFSLDAATLEQIQPPGAAKLGHAPRTLIANGQNRLLYSDLTGTESLVALTNPAHGNPPALLVHQVGGYRLLVWSASREKFESLP